MIKNGHQAWHIKNQSADSISLLPAQVMTETKEYKGKQSNLNKKHQSEQLGNVYISNTNAK